MGSVEGLLGLSQLGGSLDWPTTLNWSPKQVLVGAVAQEEKPQLCLAGAPFHGDSS